MVDPRCDKTIFQLKRFLWDDYKRGNEHDLKQKPKSKHSDFPTLLKYIVNSSPTFRSLAQLNAVYHRPGVRTAVGY